MDHATRREIDRLVTAVCEGSLTETDANQLDRLLRSDADCRRHYMQMMDLHAGLVVGMGESGSPLDPPDPITPATRAIPWTTAAWLATALSVVAASLVVYVVLGPQMRKGWQPESPTTAPYVATLVAADGIWEEGESVPPVGGRLGARELRLRSGVAKVHFDGGSTLLLRGPAVLRIESATAARIESGEVVFENWEFADEFTLTTPYSTLTDLGTEYAVVVGPSGEEVHVFDGVVRRKAGGVPDVELQAGQAQVFPHRSASRPIDADRSRFPVSPTPPRVAGTLLASESFDYPVGTDTNDMIGGTGWAGAWSRASNQDALRLNSSFGLGRPDAAPGGCIEDTKNGIIRRRLATPIRTDIDAVYYVSCLFRQSSTVSKQSGSLHVVLSGMKKGEHIRFGVALNSILFSYWDRSWSRLAVPLNPNQPYLLVAKLATSRTNPDQLFLRVYAPHERVDLEEPAGWTTVGRHIEMHEQLDRLTIQFKGEVRQAIDEIRLGTSWAAVAAPWAATSSP